MHNLQYVTHLNTGISHKRYRFYEKKSSRTKANCNRMQKSYSEKNYKLQKSDCPLKSNLTSIESFAISEIDLHIDGLVQERHNSIANSLELSFLH